MTEESFERAMRSFCKRQPFRPFFLELITRERMLVHHPEAVTHRGSLAVFVTPLAQYHLFDSSSVCRILDPGRD